MADRRQGFGLTEQFRLLGPLLVAWTLGLGALVVLCLQDSVPFEQMTYDPVAAAGMPWYVGALSNLGIVVWSAAVVTAAGGAWVAARSERPSAARFLGVGSFVGTILLLDDLFQFHADLLPATLGVTKAVALGMVLAPGVAWVLCWRADIARARWLILASSGVGSLCALAADLFGNPDRSATLLVEDGAKLLAIVAWAVYFTTTTVDIVASAIERRPDPDHDATPEDRAAKLVV